jgi:hypothetical protein
VGEDGHSALGCLAVREGPLAERLDAHEHVHHEELPDHDPRRHDEGDPHEEPQQRDRVHDENGRPWIQHQVRARDRGDRSRSPDHGHRACPTGGNLGKGGNQAAEKVEGKVPPVAERVLDVVTENPQEEQVPAEMHEVCMHEHARDNSERFTERIGEEARRDEGVSGFIPRRQRGQLHERGDVAQNEHVVHERRRANRVDVAERNHLGERPP